MPASPFRNELERVFLELLQYNINVPSSVYAKFYFDLRALAEKNNFQLQMQPLDPKRAKKLEVNSVYFRKRNNVINGVTRVLWTAGRHHV